MQRLFPYLFFTFFTIQLFGQNDLNLDSLLRVAHKKQIDKAKIEANLELFLHYEYNVANDKLARTYLDTAQFLLEKYPDANLEVVYNRIVGSYFCLASNYELGVEYFQKNVTYYENIGDELQLAIAKFKMANHLQDLGEGLGGHAASSRIDKEVLPIFIKYKDDYHYCGVLVEELYNFPEDGAATNFRKAADFCLAECAKFDDWYNQMYAYDAMLKMYCTRSYYNDVEANDLLKNFGEIIKKDLVLDNQLFAMYWQSPVFLKQKKYDLAIQAALKYQNLAKSPTQITQNKEIFDVISKAYQAKGDFVKAIQYKDSVLIYSDRIAENRHENAAFALEMKYRSERSKVALQEAKTKQNYLIGGLCFLFLLASFIYYQSNQKTIVNKRLSISYTQIEKQKNQLQLLMRELHHRVKNNLQLIASLMSIQSLQTDDEKTKTVLQEGKQRVESISMIHQRLYKNDNISEVDFETYIKDLVEKNLRAYQYNYDTLQTDILIEDNLLSPDECIPLGLIVNELLTNSFKYAFPKVEKPILHLHLKRYNNEQFKLEYADNGEGLGDIKIDDIPSFGLNLIKMLSQQLGGNYTFESNNGLRFELIFKRG
jgi:two-component sensor histidine kinase